MAWVRTSGYVGQTDYIWMTIVRRLDIMEGTQAGGIVASDPSGMGLRLSGTRPHGAATGTSEAVVSDAQVAQQFRASKPPNNGSSAETESAIVQSMLDRSFTGPSPVPLMARLLILFAFLALLSAPNGAPTPTPARELDTTVTDNDEVDDGLQDEHKDLFLDTRPEPRACRKDPNMVGTNMVVVHVVD